jgi:hypothetical protein
VVSTRDWRLHDITGSSIMIFLPLWKTYHWLSADRILYFDQDDHCHLYNTATGTRTALTALERRLPARIMNLQYSPDGQWILCTTSLSPLEVRGMRLDGSHYFQFRSHLPADINTEAIWSADSHHWLEMVWRQSGGRSSVAAANLHSLPPDHAVVKLDMQLPAGTYVWQDAVEPGKALLVIDDKFRATSPTLRIARVPFSGKQEPAHWSQASFPPGTSSGSFSPQRDRLAYMTVSTPKPGYFERLLARIRTEWKREIRPEWRLWVANLDGSHRHEVGYMVQPPDHPPGVAGQGGWMSPSYPQELKWLPDGKRLSYVFDDALYTVPVE